VVGDCRHSGSYFIYVHQSIGEEAIDLDVVWHFVYSHRRNCVIYCQFARSVCAISYPHQSSDGFYYRSSRHSWSLLSRCREDGFFRRSLEKNGNDICTTRNKKDCFSLSVNKKSTYTGTFFILFRLFLFFFAIYKSKSMLQLPNFIRNRTPLPIQSIPVLSCKFN
jgi:hypothetical protein